MTDGTKAVVWDAVFKPFGEVASLSGTAVNDNRFPGQLADAVAGFHYNYFRDYDPTTGRYMQSDSIGLEGGLNTYGYAYANPVSLVDPKGLDVTTASILDRLYKDLFGPRFCPPRGGAWDPNRVLSEANEDKPTIHEGQQGKHRPGHRNFVPGRSELDHPNPPELLDDFAGKGEPANDVPIGEPGSRERVDFGDKIIGSHVDLDRRPP
ncbi:MAG: polymorphic toxin type 50 domain-containing protein [Kiloniellales bacterium]|nr:polymorphic toxin type 50 domain-containing protein [Kiloniellales bacterium]